MTRNDKFEREGEDAAIGRLLDQIELVNPPEDLKQNVLRAIANRPRPASIGWLETFRAGLKRHFFVQLYPFAAGAAVGVIAFALLYGTVGTREMGAGPMAGAMIPGLSQSPAAVVDDQPFELNGANVRFEVVRTRDQVWTTVFTDSPDEVAITLQYPSKRLSLNNLQQVGSHGGGVDHGSGWVRIRQVGEGRVQLVLKESGAGDTPIQIGIRAKDGTIQGVLHTRKQGA